jgi:hypothetical protein
MQNDWKTANFLQILQNKKFTYAKFLLWSDRNLPILYYLYNNLAYSYKSKNERIIVYTPIETNRSVQF